MLTTVILEGPMGKAFGRKWELVAASPADALRMINANKPGLFAWIKNHLNRFANYKVICEYANGRKEAIDTDGLHLRGQLAKIRFVPLVAGASAQVRFVVGAVMAVVGYYFGWTGIGAWVGNMGVAMMIGATVEMLTGRPKTDTNENKNKTSYVFDGPTNTERQGVPVPVIIGRNVLVGSHPISASVSVDQLL
ncbi:tail assembly protein [Herbaspirillum huttiense]|uniref:Tail assembly protein n=1 Tax=Herbaspirillum huttiense subsp. lycopersici TaxID=3074428 RepID=A0ABU2EFV8_9BURK|nr:tail assembly protein [Herbaspirillum huttiense]MDR9847011.1 tail assembly protein [Herbaspirillum huttiense SE1]